MNRERELYIRRLLFIAKLALLLVLGYTVAKVVFPSRIKLVPPATSGQDSNGVGADRTGVLGKLSLEKYAEIITADPFNSSTGSVNAAGWALTGVSFSIGGSVSEELGLALQGTISGSPAVARAVIKDLKTDRLKLYKTGQVVGEARIEAIEADAVILLHNGETKVLRLYAAQFGGANDNVPLATDRPISRTSQTISPGAVGSGTGVDSDSVGAILKTAFIKSYVVADEVKGLKITGLENVKPAKDIGLRDGDVICMVNGHVLTSKQKAYQVFKKAKSGQAIDIELLRDGKTKRLLFGL
jgi:type II secretory pathway component PulC